MHVLKKAFAGQLLASAVKFLFPSAKLKGGHSSPLCFYYDFCLDFTLSNPEIAFIEEKMGQLLRQRLKGEVLEMLPSVAAEMLFQKKEPFLAEKIKAARSTTVKIFRMENIYDFLEEEGEEGEFALVKIAYVQKLEEGIWRITAVVGEAKDEIKEKLKAAKFAKDFNHVATAQKLSLFEIKKEGIVWQEKGEKMKEQFLKACHSFYLKFVTGCISTPTFDPLYQRFDRYAKKGQNTGEIGLILKTPYYREEGLFGAKIVYTDLLRLFGTREVIQKNIEDLLAGFKEIWSLADLEFNPMLENSFDDLLKSKNKPFFFYAKDLYQKERPLSSLFLKKREENLYQLDATFFLSLEAFIAVSLERAAWRGSYKTPFSEKK